MCYHRENASDIFCDNYVPARLSLVVERNSFWKKNFCIILFRVAVAEPIGSRIQVARSVSFV